MGDHYILVDGEPVETDVLTWAKTFDNGMRRVALTSLDMRGVEVPEDSPDAIVDISTVFLGLDHNFGYGSPVLWESMVFIHEPTVFTWDDKRMVHDRTSIDGSQERYRSREDALAGHARLVAIAARALRERLPLLTAEGTHWYDADGEEV